MSTAEKLKWIQNDFINAISTLDAKQKGNWGVMNAQEMVEHMSYSVRQANGKDKKVLLTLPEHLERYRTFMISDKPFKENTKNIELGETPSPLNKSSMKEAIDELKKEIDDFILHYAHQPGTKLMNPFFGEMNYDEWVHLLHKHAMHHANQFGLFNTAT